MKDSNNYKKFLQIDDNPDSFTIRKCKTCGDDFIITHSEFVWYKERKMSVPANCKKHRGREK